MESEPQEWELQSRPSVEREIRSRQEKRELVMKESASILAKRLQQRQRTKLSLYQQQAEKRDMFSRSRSHRIQQWVGKTCTSPFAVDLLAEEERIAEENKIREEEEEKRFKFLQKKKAEAMNDIVLKALQEYSDLDALRREKRAIAEEEKRLKALLALEKTSRHAKQDRLAAERAEKTRHKAKLTYRRDLFRAEREEFSAEELEALRAKHNLPPLSR